MNRLALALPLIVSACGDDVESKLAKCKDDIRAEMTALVEQARSDTAESLKELEALRPPGGSQETTGAGDKLSDSMIQALPEMLAAAVPMLEAQLMAFEPTRDGLSQCEAVLAQTRQH
jgi:hypothetical protein